MERIRLGWHMPKLRGHLTNVTAKVDVFYVTSSLMMMMMMLQRGRENKDPSVSLTEESVQVTYPPKKRRRKSTTVDDTTATPVSADKVSCSSESGGEGSRWQLIFIYSVIGSELNLFVESCVGVGVMGFPRNLRESCRDGSKCCGTPAGVETKISRDSRGN